MVCHHYCNDPLTCPECIRRFWTWAENYSRRFERPRKERRSSSPSEVA